MTVVDTQQEADRDSAAEPERDQLEVPNGVVVPLLRLEWVCEVLPVYVSESVALRDVVQLSVTLAPPLWVGVMRSVTVAEVVCVTEAVLVPGSVGDDVGRSCTVGEKDAEGDASTLTVRDIDDLDRDSADGVTVALGLGAELPVDDIVGLKVSSTVVVTLGVRVGVTVAERVTSGE